jgi:hypothetical protein
MPRYGMEHFRAFALIVRWSRLTHTPVHSLADWSTASAKRVRTRTPDIVR